MSLPTLLSFIESWSRQTPDTVALLDADSGQQLTYAELGRGVERYATSLMARGVGAGDRAIVILPRTPEMVQTVLAMSRVGAECVVMDFDSPTKTAFDDACRILKPKYVVAARGNGNSEAWRSVDQDWMTPDELADGSVLRLTFELSSDRVLYLNSTSGSTGLAKVVAATNRQVIANAAACVASLPILGGKRHLSTFKVHAHELFARSIVTGGTAVLSQQVEDPLKLRSLLAQYRVNYLMTNPFMLTCLSAVLRGDDRLPELLLIEAGGGPLSRLVQDNVSRRTGARVISVWGSTETTGVALAPPADERGPRGAIGRPLMGYQVELKADDGAGVNEGELVIKGSGVADGYVAAGSSTLKDGVFQTGDLARYHSGGWIELRGRAASSFKVAGHWVNAERIERVLRELPGVQDAMVLPFPDALLGHVPVALIETADSSFRPNLRNMVRHLENPATDLPEAFLLVERLPRVAGKPSRQAARAMLPETLGSTKRTGGHRLAALTKSRTSRRRALMWTVIRHPVASLRLLRLLNTLRSSWEQRA